MGGMTAAAMMGMAGTALQVGATYQSGQNANKMAQAEARQLEYQAGQARAVAQRESLQQRQQQRLALSRLQAVAGGGGLDEGVVDIAGDLAQEGEFRVLNAMFEGNSRASSMEAEAGMRRAQGKAAKRAATVSALSSAIGAGASLYDKYGPKKTVGGGDYRGAFGILKTNRGSGD